MGGGGEGAKIERQRSSPLLFADIAPGERKRGRDEKLLAT